MIRRISRSVRKYENNISFDNYRPASDAIVTISEELPSLRNAVFGLKTGDRVERNLKQAQLKIDAIAEALETIQNWVDSNDSGDEEFPSYRNHDLD